MKKVGAKNWNCRNSRKQIDWHDGGVTLFQARREREIIQKREMERVANKRNVRLHGMQVLMGRILVLVLILVVKEKEVAVVTKVMLKNGHST